MRERVLVAIPAWNESGAVAETIAEVTAAGVADEILVVDDGSDDGTGHVARSAGAHVLTLPFNVGVGGAMRTAFLHARHRGYRVVVQVDADGQHDPAEIPSLLSALEKASLVIGSRFRGSGKADVSIVRRPVMAALAFTLSRVVGTQLTDTTSGFRAFDHRAIALFATHYPAEYLGDTVESTVIAARANLKVAEVPVNMRTRRAGTPSQGSVKQTLYVGRALLALVSALSRKRHPNEAVAT